MHARARNPRQSSRSFSCVHIAWIAFGAWRWNRTPGTWEIVHSDKYCLGGSISHMHGSTPSGNYFSISTCQSACVDDPLCQFYLYRHDPGARIDTVYICALFAKCDEVFDYTDGDGGHIYEKPASGNREPFGSRTAHDHPVLANPRPSSAQHVHVAPQTTARRCKSAAPGAE